MEQVIKTHVGLDVHKDTITVALAEAGRQAGKVLCTLEHDVSKLMKLLRKVGEASTLEVVYEAGPTGYGLQRALAAKGYHCEVVAPSQTPRRPGSRIKTDARDSLQLAECSRAGLLRSVWVPDAGDEAIRDLARAREDAVHMRTQLRQQLKGFLLRHGISYEGKTSWTRTFERWLGTLSFEAAAQTAFTEYWLATKAGDQRVERLSQALTESVKGWRFEPVVKALQALRGIDVISAVALTAEIGDFRRFDHPRKLMSYLGLVPSEHSSGQSVHRGSITKTGNAHARTLLTEAAWHYRFPARIGSEAARRQSELSQSVRAVAWKAQLRLSRRFAVLNGRGVQRNKVCVAVARELAGFVWAVARTSLDEHLASLQAPQALGGEAAAS